MSYRYDVVATIGTYEKDGETRYITRKVGGVISTDKGFRMKLDASFNPAGCRIGDDGSVWLAFFEPKQKEEQQQQRAPQRQAPRQAQQQAPQAPDDFDQDIPFD